MEFEHHVDRARRHAQEAGAHDCVHHAEGWRQRSDVLYAIANAEYERSGLKWWEGEAPHAGGQPYLLADGRMVIACATVWFVERRP